MERFFNTFCLAFTTRGSGNEGRDTCILRIISINLKLCGESFGNEISVKMLIRNGAKYMIYDATLWEPFLASNNRIKWYIVHFMFLVFPGKTVNAKHDFDDTLKQV